mgnify:CR=1 FL=1
MKKMLLTALTVVLTSSAFANVTEWSADVSAFSDKISADIGGSFKTSFQFSGNVSDHTFVLSKNWGTASVDGSKALSEGVVKISGPSVNWSINLSKNAAGHISAAATWSGKKVAESFVVVTDASVGTSKQIGVLVVQSGGAASELSSKAVKVSGNFVVGASDASVAVSKASVEGSKTVFISVGDFLSNLFSSED